MKTTHNRPATFLGDIWNEYFVSKFFFKIFLFWLLLWAASTIGVPGVASLLFILVWCLCTSIKHTCQDAAVYEEEQEDMAEEGYTLAETVSWVDVFLEKLKILRIFLGIIITICSFYFALPLQKITVFFAAMTVLVIFWEYHQSRKLALES